MAIETPNGLPNLECVLRASFDAINPDDVFPSVIFRERWLPEPSPVDGAPTLVGTGWFRTERFDRRSQDRLLAWIARANWLKRLDILSTREHVQRVCEFLDQFGAVSLQFPHPGRLFVAPDGDLIDRSGRSVTSAQAIQATGQIVVGAEQATTGPQFVSYADLCVELDLLHQIMLALACEAKGRPDKALQVYEALMPEVVEDARAEAGDDAALALFIVSRAWISIGLRLNSDLIAVPLVTDMRSPAKIIVRGRRPLDSLWLSLAVTIGHIEAPEPIEGIFVCAYQPCGRAFIRSPRQSRGKLSFCRPRCSQSFYAKRRTEQVRAERKAAQLEATSAL